MLLDGHQLCGAAPPERDSCCKASPSGASFEIPLRYETREITFHATAPLLPMALDAMAVGDNVAVDIDAVAVAGANESLRESRALLEKRAPCAAGPNFPISGQP